MNSHTAHNAQKKKSDSLAVVLNLMFLNVDSLN